MKMEIRYAVESDLYRIAEMTRALTLHLGAFEWTVENHLKHVKRRFSNSRYIHLVAVDNDKIIGFTGAELKSKHTAYMMKGYVEPTSRRTGVMRQMESRLVEILRDRGVSTLELKVYSTNKEGRSTWVALGYQTVRETMQKRLS